MIWLTRLFSWTSDDSGPTAHPSRTVKALTARTGTAATSRTVFATTARTGTA